MSRRESIRSPRNQDRQIILETNSSEYEEKENLKLCCRKEFVLNEQFGPQSRHTEYKNYSYPWDKYEKIAITNCICAFLNTSGGCIYIGISETTDLNKRQAKGVKYEETQKEQLKKDVRNLAQKISPDIVGNQFVNIQFLPVISRRTRNPIKKKFIVKISVFQGNIKKLYFIFNRESYENQYFFRTESQVVCRSDQKRIEEILSQRQSGTSIQCLFPHQSPCSGVYNIRRPNYVPKIRQVEDFSVQKQDCQSQTYNMDKIISQEGDLNQEFLIPVQTRVKVAINYQQPRRHNYKSQQDQKNLTCVMWLAKGCQIFKNFIKRTKL